METDDPATMRLIARVIADELYPRRKTVNRAAYEGAYRALQIASASVLILGKVAPSLKPVSAGTAWIPDRCHDIAGRGTVYVGPYPFDDGCNPVGRELMVDGERRRVIGLEWESFGGYPKKGAAVGIRLSAPLGAEGNLQAH